jgi:hypothetical protein
VSSRTVRISRLLLALAALLTSRSASAEPCARELTAKALPRANELSKQGKDAFAAGRFDEALGYFEQAYCVLPAPVLHHNVSKTHLKLGHCAEAISEGRRWVDEADASERTDATAWMTEVRASCAPVALESIPSGATFAIDQDARTGQTPWQGWLASGPHALKLSHPDYLEAAMSFVAGAPGADREEGLHLVVTLAPTPPAPPPAAAPLAAPPARPAAPTPPTVTTVRLVAIPPGPPPRASPKWPVAAAMFGAAVAAGITGVSLGYGTDVFHAQPITERQALGARPYAPAVYVTLSIAGALAIAGATLSVANVALAPASPSGRTQP